MHGGALFKGGAAWALLLKRIEMWAFRLVPTCILRMLNFEDSSVFLIFTHKVKQDFPFEF